MTALPKLRHAVHSLLLKLYFPMSISLRLKNQLEETLWVIYVTLVFPTEGSQVQILVMTMIFFYFEIFMAPLNLFSSNWYLTLVRESKDAW